MFEPKIVAMRPRPRLLAFGVFELDTSTGELRKEGRLIHLRHQPVGVLRMLLEKAGELVTRRELTDALWPDGIDVDVEQGLNHCMKEIRAALGDRPESPRFIQTLPRRGYRFLVGVHEGRDARALPEPPPEEGGGAEPEPAAAATPDASGALRVRVAVTRPSDEAVLWTKVYDLPTCDADALAAEVTAGIQSGLRQILAARAGLDTDDREPALKDGRFE